MSGDVRRSVAASILACIIVGSAIGGRATAQSPDASPDSSTGRCAGWGTAGAVSPNVAALPGSMAVSAQAVEAGEDVPLRCELATQDADAIGSQELRELVDLLGFDRLFVLGDARDDQLTLHGGPVAGEVDPALDLTGIRFAGGSVSRKEAADVRRFLRQATRVGSTFGVPPASLIKPGDWHLYIVDTAGDPTGSTDTVRTWEIGVPGRNAMRNVPGFPGIANPYAGIQHLYTYAQVPVDGGGFDGQVGRTDFGSDRPGPDGRTPFFNKQPPGFAAITFDDAVAFLVSVDRDPLAFRVFAHGGGTDGWDLGTGPGGPMAFIPTDGSSPGVIDLFQPLVSHRPITQPATVDGESQPAHVFGSRVELVFGSPLLDPSQPITIDLGYRGEGSTVRIDDLMATPQGNGLFATSFGVQRPGVYELDRFLIQELARAPRSQAQGAEATHIMGTPLFRIGEEEGPLHGPLIGPWVHGQGTAPTHRYDPVLLDILVAPGPLPSVVRRLLSAGDVAEPTVDIVEVGAGRGAADADASVPFTFLIRTAGGPTSDDAYSNMVGIRCRDASDAAATGNAFSITREHHDGAERIITEGIAESTVTYTSEPLGHSFRVMLPPGAEDFIRFCEAFSGFMSTPDGPFLEDASGPIEVGQTRPLHDVVATLRGLMGQSPEGGDPRVSATALPAGDIDAPHVDITGLAVARADLGGGRTQVGLGIRTAGTPPPPNDIQGTFGTAERVDCRLVRRGTDAVITEFSIIHHQGAGTEQIASGPYAQLPPGARYQQTPWGHVITFELDAWPEDAELRCKVTTSQGRGVNYPLSDTTGEVVIKRPEPVERGAAMDGILAEIEEVFVPA